LNLREQNSWYYLVTFSIIIRL